ncbi:MAG TPA: phytanoyl-CoA dioxygenase family protein [Planctomycetota bacterium]
MNAAGFEIVEGALSAKDCDVLLASLGKNGGRAGARHLMRNPAVAAFARRRDLVSLAGGGVPYRATLFEKSGARNWLATWHQDTTLPLERRLDSPEWGPWSEKDGILYAHAPAWALRRITALRIHLDASTPDNGPLRVIPGSHADGVLSDEDVFRRAREGTSTTCLAGRGAVLAMRPLLIHASVKAVGPAPRRVLHLEYADTLRLSPGIALTLA